MTKTSLSPLSVRWLGRVEYSRALALQETLVAERRKGAVSDVLLLLEHPPVVTLGRGADTRHVLAEPDLLARRGIELHEAGRGGDVTVHGPGQLVGYPILALPKERQDAHRYLRDLEECLIRAVASWGVAATRAPGLTGVWVGRDKLAAIGVRLASGWVTSHGFALNVDVDLDAFSCIVPCGLADRGVTSLERLLPSPPSLREVAARVADAFAAVFELEPCEAPA